MKPQRNRGSPLSQLARLRVSSPMTGYGGLSTRAYRAYNARVIGPPLASLLLRGSSSPARGLLINDVVTAPALIDHNHHGNNTRYCSTNTARDSNQQTHHHNHTCHVPKPSSLHSGLFSCSTTGSDIRKWEASSTLVPPYTLSSPSPGSVSLIGQSPISPTVPSYPISSTSNGCFLILPHRPSPRRPMAFSTYSTASSDISTPRSASPSSIASARSSHSSVSSKRLSLSLQRRQSALNPMSSVDISAIEEQMKMAALDGLRGYAQNHYGEVQQYRSTDYVPQSAAGGYQVLREPLWNKGMRFTNFNKTLCCPDRGHPLTLKPNLPRSLFHPR